MSTMRIKLSNLRAVITESIDAAAAYELLGVAPGATPAEIRSAWHKLINQYRFDKSIGDPTARAKIQSLNQATKILLGRTSSERKGAAELPDVFKNTGRKAKDSYKVYPWEGDRSVVRVGDQLYGTGPSGELDDGEKTVFKKNDRANVSFNPDDDGRVTVSKDDYSQVWNPVDEVAVAVSKLVERSLKQVNKA